MNFSREDAFPRQCPLKWENRWADLVFYTANMIFMDRIDSLLLLKPKTRPSVHYLRSGLFAGAHCEKTLDKVCLLPRCMARRGGPLQHWCRNVQKRSKLSLVFKFKLVQSPTWLYNVPLSSTVGWPCCTPLRIVSPGRGAAARGRCCAFQAG